METKKNTYLIFIVAIILILVWAFSKKEIIIRDKVSDREVINYDSDKKYKSIDGGGEEFFETDFVSGFLLGNEVLKDIGGDLISDWFYPKLNQRCKDSLQLQIRTDIEIAKDCIIRLKEIPSKNGSMALPAVIASLSIDKYSIDVLSSKSACEYNDEHCAGGNDWYRLQIMREGKQVGSYKIGGMEPMHIWEAVSGDGKKYFVIEGTNWGMSLYAHKYQIIYSSDYEKDKIIVGPQITLSSDFYQVDPDDVKTTKFMLIKDIEFAIRIDNPFLTIP